MDNEFRMEVLPDEPHAFKSLLGCIAVVAVAMVAGGASCSASGYALSIEQERTRQAMAQYRIDYERLDAQVSLMREQGNWPSVPVRSEGR